MMTARRFRLALLAGSALLPAVAMAQTVAPNAQPAGGRVVAGAASIAQTATATTINQSTSRAAIDWNTFNVGANQTVQFNQPSAQSWTLNRITTPDPSVIAGRISANGGVAIINQSGVVFAEGAQVNVANLIASAANITNQDFMAGRMAFTGAANPGARVENRGTITVADHGLAVLAGPRAANSGTINARLGRVALAGAEAFTLDLAGDGMLSLDVTQQVRSLPDGGAALVTNSGSINARGGSVQLTASAASGVVETLVNNTGSIAVGRGQAVLRADGGNVVAGGSITARSRSGQGGSISATATGDVTVPAGAVLDASGATGGGRVAVGSTTTRRATVAAGATVRADATRRGNGGTVMVNSAVSTTVHGQLAARGGAEAGDGGLVETSGSGALLLTQLPDVSAPAGQFGTWLLDPVNITIRNSNASGATESNGSLTAGAFTTDGAGGNPITVIIDPTVIENYNGNVILTATNALTVSSAIDKTAGNGPAKAGTVTLAAGAGGITINATVAVDSGVTLIGDSIALNAAVSTLATNGVVLQSSGAITQSATGTITTGLLTVRHSNGTDPAGSVVLGLANHVVTLDALATAALTFSNGANALTVAQAAGTVTTLSAASLNLTGAVGGTTSVALTSTGGTIGQGAAGLITTPLLSVSATGGDVTLTEANVVDSVGISAAGRAASFVSTADLTVTATSGTVLDLTGKSLNLTGAVGGTTSVALTSTGGTLGQGAAGLITTPLLSVSGTGGDVTLTEANVVDSVGISAAGQAASFVSTADLTVTATSGTVLDLTGKSLNLTGAVGGSTSVALTSTNGAVGQGAAGLITTPLLSLSATGGDVTLTEANAVDSVGISAAGQAASFVSVNALTVTATSGAVLALTGLSLNLTGAVGGTTSVALTSTGGAVGQGAAGLITTPLLSVSATGGDVTLTEANVVDSVGISAAGQAASFVSVNALTVTATSGAVLDLTGKSLNLTGAVGGTTSVALTSTDGAVGQTAAGLLTTPLLSVSATGGDVTLTEANVVDSVGIAAAGQAASFVSTADLTVTATSGTVLDLTGKSLNLTGAVGGTISVALTSTAGGITQTAAGLLTTPLLSVSATGGDVTLTEANAADSLTLSGSAAASFHNAAALAVTSASAGGALTLTSAGDLTANGLLHSGGALVVTATGGNLSIAAAGADGTSVNLSTVTSGDITLGGVVASAGNITITSAGGVAVNANIDGSVTGSVSVTAAGGDLIMASGTTVFGHDATLEARDALTARRINVTEFAELTARTGTLTLEGALTAGDNSWAVLRAQTMAFGASGNINLDGSVYLLPYTAGTAVTLGGSGGLSITTAMINKIATNNGALIIGADGNVTTAGAITIAGAVQLRGAGHGNAAWLDLEGDSIATTSGGFVNVAHLTGTALTGDFIANSTSNQIDNADWLDAAGIIDVYSSLAMSLTSTSTVQGGGTSRLASAVSLTLDGEFLGSGPLQLRSDGAISQISGRIVATDVTVAGDTAASSGAVDLRRTGNDFSSIAVATVAGTVQVHSSAATAGLLTVNATGGTSVSIESGRNLTTAGLVSGSAGVTLTGAGTVTLGSAVEAATGDIGITATLRSNVSAISQTAGSVTASSDTATVTFTADSITLASAAGSVSTGAAGITGSVVLAMQTAGQGITLGGSPVASTQFIEAAGLAGISTGHLTIGSASAGNIAITGSFIAPAVLVDLISGGSITQGGASSIGAPTLRATATGGISLAGTLEGTTAVVLQADGAISQSAGSLTTPLLTLRGSGGAGTSATSINLAQTDNSIETLAEARASGTVAVTSDAATFTITQASGAGVTLTAGHDLALTGTVDAGAQALALKAAGNITSGGTLTAATVAAEADGNVSLASGAGGSLPVLLNSSADASGSFEFSNGGATEIRGTLSAGTVVVTSDGTLTLAATGAVSGEVVTLQGGRLGGGLVLNGAVDGTMGVALLSGTFGGGAIVGEGISQGAAGVITTPMLVVLSSENVSLGGANQVDRLAGQAAGTLAYTGAVAVAVTSAALDPALGAPFSANKDALASLDNMTLSAPGITVGSGASLGSTNGTLALNADAMALAGTVGSASSVTLRPLSADTDINVGGAASGVLLLDPVELAGINATSLLLHATGSGAVLIAADLDLRGLTTALLDLQGGSVSQTAGTRLDVAKVTGSASTGGFALDSTANTFDEVGAITAATNVALTTASALLTVSGTVAAGNGGSLTLRADDLALGAALQAPGGGTVNLMPNGSGVAVTLGTTAIPAGLYLDSTELALITTGGGVLRVGGDGTSVTAGAITLADNLALRGVAARLDLRGDSVAQGDVALDVARLTGATSGDFMLLNAGNTLDTLGDLSGASIGIRNGQALAVVGAVQAAANGTAGLASSGELSVAASGSVQAGTRAGADTGTVNLWGGSIVLAGAVEAGNLITLLAHDSMAAGPGAAVAGADISQSGLGLLTARRVFAAASGDIALGLDNVVDRAALLAFGTVNFNSTVALVVKGGLAAPIPDGGSFSFADGAKGTAVTLTSSAGLDLGSSITATSGDVTLAGAGTVTLAADVTATQGSVGITAAGADGEIVRSSGTVTATAANQFITLTADSMDFGVFATPVLRADTSSGTVRLRAHTAGLDVSLGAIEAGKFSIADTGGTLAEAGRLQIGSATGGDINVAGSFNAGLTTLELLSGGDITQSSGAALSASRFSATATGDILLGGANGIGSVAGSLADSARGISAGGDVTLTSTAALLTVNAAITTGNTSTLTLQADDLALAARLVAPGGVMRLLPYTAGRGITLGGSAAGTLALSNAELALVGGSGANGTTSPLARLRIGSDSAGGMALAGDVDLRDAVLFNADRALVLELRSGGSISQSAGTRLNVAALAAQGGSVALGSAANTVDEVVLGTTDAGVAAAHGLRATTGSATLTSLRDLIVQADVAAAGSVSLTGDGLTNNASISAGTVSPTGDVTLTAAGSAASGFSNTGSISAARDVTVQSTAASGTVDNSGSIEGRDISFAANASITNQASGSATAGRNLAFGQGSAAALSNAGTLAAGTAIGGGDASLDGGSVVNSGSIAAGTSTLAGNIIVTSSDTGIHNQAGGSMVAANALTLNAALLGVTNDGTLQSGAGLGGGSLTVNANSLTNNASMQAGSATRAGGINITLADAPPGSLTNADGATMQAGDGISVDTTAAVAAAATLGGTIQAGLRAGGAIAMDLHGGSFSVTGSLEAQDITLAAATGSTSAASTLVASRDLRLSLGGIGSGLDGDHSAGRDLSVGVAGSGNVLVLAGSWVAQRNVSLAGPAGITINGLVGTDGTGTAGAVDLQSSDGTLALGGGGLLYGRLLQGALGTDTTLVNTSTGPGVTGLAVRGLGTLAVAGDLSLTTDTGAAAAFGIEGIVSVGSGKTLKLLADDLAIGSAGGLRAPAGSIVLGPYTGGRAVTLGGNASGTLSLETDELSRIGSSGAPAAAVTIGTTSHAQAGDIALVGDVNFGGAGSGSLSRADSLTLLGAGHITQSAGAALVTQVLNAQAPGDILLDPGGSTNRIAGIGLLQAGGDAMLRSDAALVTVSTAATAGTGRLLRLRVDDLDIPGSVAVTGGTIELLPATAGRGVTLGGSAGGTLSLDTSDLAHITGMALLRVGGIGADAPIAGDITITGIATLGGSPTLDLRSTGSILGGSGNLTVGLVNALAAQDVLLDGPDNHFTVGAVTAGNGRTIRLSDPPDLVLTGPISAPGGLVVLSSGDAILQQPGAIITTGTLVLQAGGRVTLNEANQFGTLGASSMAGGSIHGGSYVVIGPLTLGGDLTLIADGTLGVPGNVGSTGSLTLLAGGAISLAGNTSTAGALTIQAGEEITLTGATNAGTTLELQAGTTLTLNGSITANAPLNLSAGADMALGGSISTLGDLTLLAGGSLSLAGTLTSTANITGTAGGAASFGGAATAAGRFSLSASSSMVLTGQLGAETASLRGAGILLSGFRASIGGAILFTAPGGIGAGGTSSITARGGGQYPAVVFDTRSGSHPDPFTQVEPDFPGLTATQQATQVRRVGQQLPGNFGPASGAAAGQIGLALDAGRSAVFLLLDGASASGNLVAGRLGIHGVNGSVNLFGTLGGTSGAAAATSADLTRPVDPAGLSNYRVNGCVVSSVNCVPPPSIQFVLLRPPGIVDLSLVNNRIDTSEVTIPNVAEIEYQ